jgi:hypothetical protein
MALAATFNVPAPMDILTHPPVGQVKVYLEFSADLPAGGTPGAGVTLTGFSDLVPLEEPASVIPVGGTDGDIARFFRLGNRSAMLSIDTNRLLEPAGTGFDRCKVRTGTTGGTSYTFEPQGLPAIQYFGVTGLSAVKFEDVGSGISASNCDCVVRRVKGFTWPVPPPGATMLERAPMDIVLVLDQSGSMILPASSGSSVARWDALETAVGEFIGNWANEGADAGVGYSRDRLGVVYFSTTAGPATDGGFFVPRGTLPPGPSHAWKPFDTDVNARGPLDMTALGQGLLYAIGQRNLSKTNDATFVVMTDGMQNINPLVRTSTTIGSPHNGYLVIDSDGGIPGTGGATEVALRAQCTPMLAVSVGDVTSPYAETMARISAETAGTHVLTTGSGLPTTFLAELVEALKGNTLTMSLNQEATMPAGVNTSSTNVLLDGTVRNAIITLGWLGANTQKPPFLRIFNPDGKQVRPVSQMNGSTFSTQRVNLPETGKAGTWRVEVARESAEQPMPFQLTVLAEEQFLELRAGVLGGRHFAGDPLTIAVDLSFDGKPLKEIDGELRLELERPNFPLGTLLHEVPTPQTKPEERTDRRPPYQIKVDELLKDPDMRERMGTTREKDPIVFKPQGNGRFTVEYADTKVPGTYRFYVTLAMKSPKNGDEIHRIETVSTVVEVLPDGTVSSVASKQLEDGSFEISFLPRDSSGNYKGPGYENHIQVRIDGDGRVEKVLDPRVDGSYQVIVGGGIQKETKVVVYVAGQPIAQGPISELKPVKPGEEIKQDQPKKVDDICGCRRMSPGTAGMISLLFLALVVRRRSRSGDE